MIEEAHDGGHPWILVKINLRSCETNMRVLPKDLRWHMIGHLQTNKIKYVIDQGCADPFHRFHPSGRGRSMQRRKSTTGSCRFWWKSMWLRRRANPAFWWRKPKMLIREIAKLSNIRVEGLMTIAPFVENAEENRQYFVKLRKLSVDIRRQKH